MDLGHILEGLIIVSLLVYISSVPSQSYYYRRLSKAVSKSAYVNGLIITYAKQAANHRDAALMLYSMLHMVWHHREKVAAAKSILEYYELLNAKFGKVSRTLPYAEYVLPIQKTETEAKKDEKLAARLSAQLQQNS